MAECSVSDAVAALPLDSHAIAALLNHGCVCSSVDHERLRRALEGEVASAGGFSHSELLKSHPRLFSDTLVFVAQPHLDFMAELVRVIDRVVALPQWRERVLAYAPDIARHAVSATGVFLGYDFHLGPEGPQLIEINTNAGGGLLNAKLLRAQTQCCAPAGALRPLPGNVEADFVAMFREEWALARGDTPLARVAIVDETPASQFLAPEFELFRQLFEASGIAALVVAPNDLSFDGINVHCGDQIVDLIYNRLTDFALEDPSNALLRAAYLADAVVLTPHPRAHALYADKRNLVALSDERWLLEISVGEADRRLLHAGVPRTEEVLPENAAAFWASRRQWFFKPAAGYGSKAAYRGDKLTKGVFEHIARGGYVAQALVLPSQRRLRVDGAEQNLKIDLRNYAYRGRVQLVSARLYQGQTTNFRTRGGGFAAVLPVSLSAASESADRRACFLHGECGPPLP